MTGLGVVRISPDELVFDRPDGGVNEVRRIGVVPDDAWIDVGSRLRVDSAKQRDTDD